MVNHPLPEWSKQYSVLLDTHIIQLVESARLDNSVEIFMPLITSATCRGRKLRSSLALRYVDWEELDKSGENYNSLLKGLVMIELLHSASCIVDDIIDGDINRRGVPSFHVREGFPQAQLVALEILSLIHYAGKPRIVNEITNTVRLMLQGEAYDSFKSNDFIKRAESEGVERLLDDYVLKTSPSFATAHKIIGISYGLSEDKICALRKYGEYLGRYYQFANDFHDTFNIPPEVRGNPTDLMRITLSMPMIIALQQKPNNYINILGKEVPRNEFIGIRDKLIYDGIDRKAQELLIDTGENVLSCYPGNVNDELRSLIAIVGSKDFWSYSYG